MTSSARRIARDLVPPALARALAGRPAGALSFVDGYDSWDAAEAAAGGYDEASILQRVQAATDEVVAGRAAFERDGVTFDQPEYRWELVTALLRSAALHGSLSVLDFGGSLGSTYRQHAALLEGVSTTWGVVEQAAFVQAGQGYANDVLSFHPTIDSCVAAVAPRVAVLSSVLQYLPDPDAVLAAVAGCGVDAIVIDRTPFRDDADVTTPHLPTVQQVPTEIYRASYAAWVLAQDRLLAAAPGWSVLAEFPSIEPDMRTTSGVPFSWSGAILTRPRT